MKEVIVLLLFMVVFQAQGQDNRFMYGFNALLNGNSYIFFKDPDGLDTKGTVNYALGITARKYFSPRFSIAASVNYATRNYKVYIAGNYYDYIGDGDPQIGGIGGSTYTYKHGYVDIPVSIAYGMVVTDKLELLPSVGVVNSVLVNNRNEVESPVQYANSALSQRPSYNNHLIAAKVGFGFLLKQEKYGILIEPETRIYATPVTGNSRQPNPFQLGLQASFLWR